MAGAYVQGATSFSGSTSVTSQTVTLTGVTAGDLIIFAWGAAGGPSPTITDSQSNTWTGPYGSNGAHYIGSINYVFGQQYCIAKSSGTLTVTLSLSFSAGFVRMLLQEYSGYGIGDVGLLAFDYAAGVTSPSTTLTTTVQNDLIVAWAVDGNGVTGYSSPLAIRQTVGSESTGDNAGATNTAGSQTVGITNSGGGGSIMGGAFIAKTAGLFVQSTSFFSSTSVTSHGLAFPANVTAGDLIVVAVGYVNSTHTAPTVTDSQGNTYTLVGSMRNPANLGSTYNMGVFYATAGSTGACTITVAPPSSSTFFRMAIHEYSGYAAFDTSAYADDASGNPTTTITTTAQSDLLFGWAIDNNNANTWTAPLIMQGRETVGSEITGDSAGYSSIAGAITVTANTGGGGSGLIVAAFKLGSATTTIAQAANVVVQGRNPVAMLLESGPINVPVTVRPVTTVQGAGAGVGAVTATAYNPTVVLTQAAAVALAGTSGMAVAASVQQLAAVTLAGGASLSVSALVTELAVVTEAATSTLTVAAQDVEAATVPLSAASSMVLAASVSEVATVALSAAAAMTVAASVTEMAAVALSATGSLTATGTVIGAGTYVPLAATAGLTVSAAPVLVLAQVPLVGSASMMVAGFLPAVVTGQVAMVSQASLALTAGVLHNEAVVLGAVALWTDSGNLPQVVTGQIAMASQASLSVPAQGGEYSSFQGIAVASLVVAVTLANETVFSARTGLYVEADTAPPVRVSLSATTSMMVSATVDHVEVTEPSLEDQVAAVTGLDPILLGATGYLDSVFTSRLTGDTE